MDATDLNLLELAGRAAGEQYNVERNPLDRDDLALRLAVKCGFVVDAHGLHTRICFPFDEESLAREPHGSDPYAATRRAIVRAAAEIGKGMR